MKIIEVQSYGGIDWHDSSDSTNYLKENDSFNITNTEKVIEDAIVKRFKEFYNWIDTDPNGNNKNNTVPDIRPSEEDIRAAIRNKQNIAAKFNGMTYNDDPSDPKVWYDCEIRYLAKTDEYPSDVHRIKEIFACGQFEYTYWFVEKEIPDENVRFLATENFPCPSKGVPSISRFYSFPVKTQTEAEKQLEELQLHMPDGDNVWVEPNKELIIFDVDITSNTMWYALNIQAICLTKELEKMKKEYNLTLDMPFKMYTAHHIEMLEKAKTQAWNMYRNKRSIPNE